MCLLVGSDSASDFCIRVATNTSVEVLKGMFLLLWEFARKRALAPYLGRGFRPSRDTHFIQKGGKLSIWFPSKPHKIVSNAVVFHSPFAFPRR